MGVMTRKLLVRVTPQRLSNALVYGDEVTGYFIALLGQDGRSRWDVIIPFRAGEGEQLVRGTLYLTDAQEPERLEERAKRMLERLGGVDLVDITG